MIMTATNGYAVGTAAVPRLSFGDAGVDVDVAGRR